MICEIEVRIVGGCIHLIGEYSEEPVGREGGRLVPPNRVRVRVRVRVGVGDRVGDMRPGVQTWRC